MKFAAYSEAQGWVVDLCVGLSFTFDVGGATWWDSMDEIDDAFKAADLNKPASYGLILVRVK